MLLIGRLDGWHGYSGLGRSSRGRTRIARPGPRAKPWHQGAAPGDQVALRFARERSPTDPRHRANLRQGLCPHRHPRGPTAQTCRPAGALSEARARQRGRAARHSQELSLRHPHDGLLRQRRARSIQARVARVEGRLTHPATPRRRLTARCACPPAHPRAETPPGTPGRAHPRRPSRPDPSASRGSRAGLRCPPARRR